MHRSVARTEHAYNPPFDQIHNLSSMELSFCNLKDDIAPDLHRIITTTLTLRQLHLKRNLLGDISYVTLADALCGGASLRWIDLRGNLHVDLYATSAAFVNSIRLNHTFEDGSRWYLYGLHNEYPRLKKIADDSAPPSMLEFILHTHKY